MFENPMQMVSVYLEILAQHNLIPNNTSNFFYTKFRNSILKLLLFNEKLKAYAVVLLHNIYYRHHLCQGIYLN